MSQVDFPKVYNPANQSPEDLIENFVVRTALFKKIYEDIQNSEMKYPEQHYIIQGVRGQGKTTMLLRIAYEIQKDNKIKDKLIPVIFNEEQYHITRLFKLWESIAEYLDDHGYIKDLKQQMEQYADEPDNEQRCFKILENALKKNNKKIIVFIDNIDDMLNKFKRNEHSRLREIFTECAEIRIIGSSSRSLEFHSDYGEPFYQFFKMPMLNGLNLDETKKLLLNLGEHYKRDRVRDIVENQQGRVEALRRITGGVIRTIVLLFEIFVDDSNGDAFRDLEKILDQVTPLYKHRMDVLPPQLQEIVDAIALNWDAISAKEIAAKTKLSSNFVSSQLKQLDKYHIVEKEKTNTKNYLYRISERFFNIWYLMRHGRKWDEKRVRFLVEFLQIWCDETELENRARRHIESLQKGGVYERQAFYMSEALARTSLKRDLEHQLLTETRTYLEKSHSDMIEHLSKSDLEHEEIAKECFEKGKFEECIKELEGKKIKTGGDYFNLGLIYYSMLNDKEKGKKYYLMAVDKGHAGSMNNLALLYKEEVKDFENAEKYYLMAVEKGLPDAMSNLALLYQQELKDFEKAERYYLMAVEKGHSEAMNNLGILYQKEFNNFKKAEKYYLMAVDNDNTKAKYNIAFLYQKEFKNFKKAEKYYLMAIEKGQTEAMNNIGVLYQKKFKDFNAAEKYYLMAIDKDHTGAMNNLALLYQEEFKDFKKAKKYYLMAIEKGQPDAINNIGILYQKEFKNLKEAEKYYLMAVDKGHAGAMNNLALFYHKEFKDYKKAEKYYLMAVEKSQPEAMNNLGSLYQKESKDFNKAEKYYLMAVEEGHAEAMNNLALLYQEEFKDFKEVEKYYLMAVDKGHPGAMNNLAWLYFMRKIKKDDALVFSEKAYANEKNFVVSHTYASVLLWDNQIQESYKIAQEFLNVEGSFNQFNEDIQLYLLLLMAKKQYHLTLKIFNENQFQLKDRFKPIYYALMVFMKKEFPNEYLKMGGEIKQTVDEIIEKVKQMAVDYV